MYMSWNDRREITVLLGKTLVEIKQEGNEEIIFVTSDGERYMMCHNQDCCETVEIESVVGDLNDLIWVPLLKVEEVTSEDTPEGFKHEYEPESQTWTFYKFATIKGYVDIRWFGSSNGYYSESVDFYIIRDDKED